MFTPPINPYVASLAGMAQFRAVVPLAPAQAVTPRPALPPEAKEQSREKEARDREVEDAEVRGRHADIIA